MSFSAQQQLNALQRSLYEKAVDEAKQLASIGAPTILNYSEKYLQSLPSTFELCDQDEVITALAEHQIALYGDFHTLRQSQRGLVRLLRGIRKKYPAKRVVLAMEMFKAQDQELVDAFLDGRLREDRFLEKISYEDNWSFPWNNYRMLLDYAQEQSVEVIGINTENAGQDALAVRDKFAANILHNIVEQDPSCIVICLIGEYHLADPHLPHCIKEISFPLVEKPRMMRIFTNVDHYYFKNEQVQNLESEYLRLQTSDFCILNVSPWIKWQSYVIWEETRGLGQHSPDDWEDRDVALYTEDGFDVDSQALELLRTLGDFLSIHLESRALTGFSVQLHPDESLLKHYIRKYRVPSKDLHAHSHRLTADGVSFLAPAGIMLVRDLSLNSLAEVCGQYLAATSWHENKATNPAEQFHRRVLKFAAGVTASKILNPRRKNRDLWSYRKLLQQSKGKRLIGSAQLKREAARWLFRYAEKVEQAGQSTLSPKWLGTMAHWDEQSLFEISRTIGEVLGHEIYQRVLQQKIPADFLREIFVKNPADDLSIKVQSLTRFLR